MTQRRNDARAGKRDMEPLEALQDAFRASYRQRKEETVASLRRGDPPVVIRASDEELLLVSARGTDRFDLETDTYDTLKKVSHVAPLATLLLDPVCEQPVEPGVIEDALEHLESRDHGSEMAVIVAETRKLLLDPGPATATRDATIARYGEAVAPVLQEAARQAARADLDALARAMRQVEASIGRQGIARAFLVVCGGHQSRRHELTRQFFRRWLDETLDKDHADPHHIIYAENREPIDEVLELVATRIVDERIGALLFKDPTRLDEDILGEVTESLLNSVASVRDFGK